jgi:hypothetical protein
MAVSREDLEHVASTWLDREPVATGMLLGKSGSDADPGR